MEDDFISITQIKSTTVLNQNDDNAIKVYQIHPYQNYINIMHVGSMPKMYDINIHSFNISNSYTCYMVNKIYNISLLNEQLIQSYPLVELISVLYCVNNNNYPSAYLAINFHPQLEKEYLSSKDNIINIMGHYSISLHFNNGKAVIIDDNYEFDNKDSMLLELHNYATDTDIISLINNNINI